MSVLQEDRMRSVGTLLSIGLGDGCQDGRLVLVNIWLGMECRDEGLALVSVCLGDGVPRWRDSIGECLARGLSAEMGGWH